MTKNIAKSLSSAYLFKLFCSKSMIYRVIYINSAKRLGRQFSVSK